MRTLFDVSIRHGFFNDAGDRCEDLSIAPTVTTAALMRDAGMVLHATGGGFVVAMPGERLAALTARVRRDPWTRLAFLLTPRTPDLLAVTGLPMTADLAAAKLHLSNVLTAMPGPGRIVLGGAEGATAAMLRPVAGARLSVPAPRRGGVALADLSGRIGAAARIAGEAAVFDLSPHPAGLYRLAFSKADGTPGAAPRGYPASLEYMHAPASPRALALLELVLAQPAAGVGDPLSFPIAGDAITPVGAELRLPTRDTVWRYYVAAARGRLSDDLAITGPDATFTRSAATLPGGQEAALFTADAALPLRRSSPYRFRLTGERHGDNGGRTELDVARLPVAPPAPVWPADTGDPLTGGSEIFVYV